MENVKLVSYADQGGVWTIGMGHTLGVTAGMTCTLDQAMIWARSDMAKVSAVVNKILHGTPKQNEFDAFVSLGFNIGIGALQGASAVNLYNAGNLTEAANHFLLWDKVKASVAEGLLKRRKCEAIILLGQPWKVATFANEADRDTNATVLNLCLAAYHE